MRLFYNPFRKTNIKKRLKSLSIYTWKNKMAIKNLNNDYNMIAEKYQKMNKTLDEILAAVNPPKKKRGRPRKNA